MKVNQFATVPLNNVNEFSVIINNTTNFDTFRCSSINSGLFLEQAFRGRPGAALVMDLLSTGFYCTPLTMTNPLKDFMQMTFITHRERRPGTAHFFSSLQQSFENLRLCSEQLRLTGRQADQRGIGT